MESERRVDPTSPNAGNPFHHCADYCTGGGAKAPVFNGEGARVAWRAVDPDCVNAANPFHRCADYCTKKTADAKKQAGSGLFLLPVLSKLSPRSHSDRSDGSKSASWVGVKAEERDVNPNCVNASNPFHKCADYCTIKTVDGRKQIRTSPKAQKGELIKEAVRKMEEGRKVDPKCVNASNLFHKCTEDCSPRAPGERRQTIEHSLGALLARETEEEMSARKNRREVVVGENRKMDPRCPNASNPFHQCAEYCLQKISGSSGSERSKSDRSKGTSIVTMKRDVDPRCPNASNPFHQCAEYCLQKTSGSSGSEISKSVIADTSKGTSIVTVKRDVDPRCVNASNPFHKCADYCFERIRKAS